MIKQEKIFIIIIIIFLSCLSFFTLPNTIRSRSPVLLSTKKAVKELIEVPTNIQWKTKSSSYPNLLSSQYILVDAKTNQIIFSKNSDQHIFPASLTKLASALTALNIYPLDEIITVPVVYDIGKTMGLQINEKISVKSLVEALLVYSANDSAYNLALHHQLGTGGFIDEMNKLMQKYNLINTHFVNFDGLHDPSHYSTVYDLSQLARLSIKNPIITDVVSQKQLTVFDTNKKIAHELFSTNELLGVVPEIKGLKTGWTPEAGGCFIALIEHQNRYLISVITQSEDRFTDTKKIIDWIKNNLYL